MRPVRCFVHRLRETFRPWRRDREFAEEVETHIRMLTQENIARGMAADEARQAARRKFGNTTMITEEVRAVSFPVWLEQLRQDVLYGFRMLSRNLAFTTVVVLTLGLAIGMNTIVFSVINAVLLQPLSYPEPERLIWVATDNSYSKEEIVPRYDFRRWREQGQSFDRMVAYESADNTISTHGRALQERIAWVSDDFWQVAIPGVAHGRLPRAGEQNVLVLSDQLFEREFQRDTSVVGAAALIDGQPATIVGVLRKEFRFQLVPPPRRGPDAKTVEAYAPLVPRLQDNARSPGLTVNVVAKLKPGVTLEQTRSELEVLRARVAARSPMPYLDKMPLRVVALQEKLVGHTRVPLLLLFGAVLFVLLIACASIANLLLARASVRHREIALRVSLGAGRGRMLRQFLTENVLLALLGCAAGLLVAHWGLPVLVRAAPDAVPRLTDTTLDARVLAFALAASVATSFLFGLAPALFLWKANLIEAMRDGARTASASIGSLHARKILVGAELALAVILLSAAGLMVKSFWRLNAHPPGFEPASILIMKVPLSGPNYVEARQRHLYIAELLRRVQSVPGLQAVGVSPDYQIRTGLGVQGGGLQAGQPATQTALNATSAGYASALGLRVVSGRWITDSEPISVVVINESLARREFGAENPIGRGLSVQAIAEDPTVTTYLPIVGVVADVRYSKLDAEPEPEVYVPYAHVPVKGSGVALVARTEGDPLVMAPMLRGVMAEIDPSQAVYDVRTLEDALTESVAPRRFIAFLLAIFAAAAFLLAVLGIYGVISFSVAQRTREIGIRLTLGARRGEVVQMVVLQGMKVAFSGIAIGLVATAGLTRVMVSLLYEVEPVDFPTFGVVATLLAVTALCACLGPALKGALIDPTTALRDS